MSDNVIDVVGKEQLDGILSAGGIVILDFWAERCGPCRMLGPVLHDIAEANDGVVVAKVDVDQAENGDLSMAYGVRSIPQVTIFKDGEQVDQFVGALPPEQIQAYIDKHTS